MNMRLLTLPVIFLLIGAVCLAGELKTEIRDNEIIALFLQSYYKDVADRGKYVVVSPETSFEYVEDERLMPEDRKNRWNRLRTYVRDRIRAGEIKLDGYDIGPIIDDLFEKNKRKARLSIKSDPKNGYIVDYDGTFEKSARKYGNQFYKENPNVLELTRVSLPGWNQEHNIFLIYTAWNGNLIAYRYEKGTLNEIGRTTLLIE